MGRFKTPQLKKLESYAHDRTEGSEYPHADRRNRPIVKALGQPAGPPSGEHSTEPPPKAKSQFEWSADEGWE